MLQPIRSHFDRAAIVASLLTLCTVLMSAQDSPIYGRTRAIDESHSQAEKQAEQMVSLSADKLIALLQKETGLLLEVKKALVRKAFEQGRILDPKELTDDALFRLLREDENIRVLATQEVSKRMYIRALPTQDERRRELALHGPTMPANKEAGTPETSDKTHIPSQEELYWSDQERRVPLNTQPAQAPSIRRTALNTILRLRKTHPGPSLSLSLTLGVPLSKPRCRTPMNLTPCQAVRDLLD